MAGCTLEAVARNNRTYLLICYAEFEHKKQIFCALSSRCLHLEMHEDHVSYTNTTQSKYLNLYLTGKQGNKENVDSMTQHISTHIMTMFKSVSGYFYVTFSLVSGDGEHLLRLGWKLFKSQPGQHSEIILHDVSFFPFLLNPCQ